MDLVKGRLSVPHARYFVTLCADRHKIESILPVLGPRWSQIPSAVFVLPDAALICATAMPDHLHLLFELGTRLTLDRLMAKFKALARRTCAENIFWQRNFYEHRLRPDESTEDVARYIFLNPYRKQLLCRTQSWPYFVRGPGVDFDFMRLLEAGQFPPEAWLAEKFEPLFVCCRPAQSVRASSAPTKSNPTSSPSL